MVQTNNKQSKSNNKKNGTKSKVRRVTTDEEKKEIEKNRLSYLKKGWALLGGK
jgi:hypothetical protein